MKMFFERETLNPNNEKYLAKTIGYKLWYTVYDSTNTTTANLISLANIEPRVKFQLPLSLVLWSCQKKIIYAMYYKHGGLRRQRIEDQALISLHLQADRFPKSFKIHVVSLGFLFFSDIHVVH